MKNVFLILLLSICWSQYYISPGIQIGVNSKEGFFYGFQVSAGLFLDEQFEYDLDRYYLPSICYGFKRFHRKYNEQYIDFQVTSMGNSIDTWKIPLGFGFGKNYSKHKTNYRIKGYTWFLSCFTLDYELDENSYNFSLIPVLPIW